MGARTSPSIGIIGAGIGGLAVAAALRRVGFASTIFEQAQIFARVGAGIQQSPNAMKVHRGLGIEDRLRQTSFCPTTSLNREASTGAVTNDHPLGSSVEEKYGAPYLTLHRGDLHAALLDLVPANSMALGKKLTSIRETDESVHLVFADGSSVDVDVLIGADGVHSLARDYVVGPTVARFTGRLAYRTTYPASSLDIDIGPSRTKWWGADRHIVIYFVTALRDEVYFVTSQPEAADWMTKESWSAKGNLDELRSAFSDFHPDVRAVLAAAPEVHKWGIFERDPLSTWSRGRVVLLADACHPMTPYMASGAAMALEDAAVFARCLAELGPSQIQEVYKAFEATRKPRASAVQAGSSANNWMRNATNPDWLYGYDAWKAPIESGVLVS
ncbi:MAG TPA: FAD-dependent monooxygenase [Xanthobacteraceae bacterium]|jgi:salicylate hydroxylase/6-hydroxynicotinate 3-monooxygenase|nr:FAD-dependent monooxygenase [Xanthobacteraceae bacterium]